MNSMMKALTSAALIGLFAVAVTATGPPAKQPQTESGVPKAGQPAPSTDKAAAKLWQLFMEEKITAEECEEGRKLITKPVNNAPGRMRRGVYLDLAAGRLLPKDLTAALAALPAPTLTLDLGGGVTMELVLVPAGAFLMGSPISEAEPSHSYEEIPQHPVRISKAFYLGRYEVTQAQWRAVMGDNPSEFEDDLRPVENITWEDGRKFCKRLSQRTGRGIRMPSEAEWEYACRAGTTTPFSFGETILTDQANYDDGTSKEGTTLVGVFPPNAWGLYGMHGNVSELCADVYHHTYNGAPGDGTAWTQGGVQGSHICRGGSRLFPRWIAPSASRHTIHDSDGDEGHYIGLRVASASHSPANTKAPKVSEALPSMFEAATILKRLSMEAKITAAQYGEGHWLITHPVGSAADRDRRRIYLNLAAGKLPPTGLTAALAAPQPTARTLDLGDGVMMELVLVPAGSFLMGSAESEEGRDGDEGPQHRVSTDKTSYLGKYEVTQAQWRAVMGDSPSHFKGDDRPVENVSWEDCQRFCQKLSQRLGESVRLPTETEWEYACRAGTATAFSFGGSASSIGRYAWYGSNSNVETHRVGGKRANAWNLYDMHGNVWEWCEDVYDYYKEVPSQGRGVSSPDRRAASPYDHLKEVPGPGWAWIQGERQDPHILRGGGWLDLPQDCRSALRSAGIPGDHGSFVGFRIVLGPQPPAKTKSRKAGQTVPSTFEETAVLQRLRRLGKITATQWEEGRRLITKPVDAVADRVRRGVYLNLATGKQSPKSLTSAPPARTLTLDLGVGVTMELVLVPSGSFLMGSPKSEEGRFNSEGPQHRVRIGKPFYLGKYEVTQAQWRAVMGDNPSEFKAPTTEHVGRRRRGRSIPVDDRVDDRPVENVSWNDCQEFCRRLSQQVGRRIRLPAEAEWEYACRAGTTTRYSFGDSNASARGFGQHAWFRWNSKGKTSRVGVKQPNGWGLYDMHGNVLEWCEDVWHDSYNGGAPSDGTAWTQGGGQTRVLRGGSFFNWLEQCRSAYRNDKPPGERNGSIGLRIASDAQ